MFTATPSPTLSVSVTWRVLPQSGKLANGPASANGNHADGSREAETLRAQLQAAQARIKEQVAAATAVQASP